jgi:exosortase/archaeosortase
MDIRVKAALRMAAVIGWAIVGVGVLYLLTMFLSDAMILGIIVGALVGILMYNLYRIFLAMEEMKERNKK